MKIHPQARPHIFVPKGTPQEMVRALANAKPLARRLMQRKLNKGNLSKEEYAAFIAKNT